MHDDFLRYQLKHYEANDYVNSVEEKERIDQKIIAYKKRLAFIFYETNSK